MQRFMVTLSMAKWIWSGRVVRRSFGTSWSVSRY